MGTSTTAQLYCQALLGERLGGEVVALIEKVDGQPCPCKRGLPCPLAPPAAEAAAV